MLGRNGVGKSSLLRAIVGHQPISSGRILWDEDDLTKLARMRGRARASPCAAGPRRSFRCTVQENLETGFAAAPGERYTPDEVFDLFPVLASMMGRRGGDLSGGQQQQLIHWRALVARPKLLVLDEPTEGIQPSIIKDIGRAIQYLRNKGEMAIVLVEQYFDFAKELADDFVVMDRGQVVMATAPR